MNRQILKLILLITACKPASLQEHKTYSHALWDESDFDWARQKTGLLELGPMPVGKLVPFTFLDLTRVQREAPEPIPHLQD